MNNLLSDCGLVDAKIRASGKDLPVYGLFNESVAVLALSHDLTTFQILGQKILIFFVGILVQTMTPKGHFEIN